jgi:hypothetical protein
LKILGFQDKPCEGSGTGLIDSDLMTAATAVQSTFDILCRRLPKMTTKPRKQADLWFSKLVLETDSQQLALASGIEKPLSVL